MTYFSFDNHFIPMLKFMTTFTLLFAVMPHIIFKVEGDTRSDALFRGYTQMVLLVVLLVYVLVPLKLYELLSIGVLLLIFMVGSWGKQKGLHSAHEIWGYLQIKLFDFLDGFRQRGRVMRYSRRLWITFKEVAREHAGWSILFFITFGYAFWLRAYDALVHAAPPFSDSYVTLVWSKYITDRLLFHDGLYPQGFHVFLSLLGKAGGLDLFYVLKYAGPLNGLWTVLSVWFFVYRVTDSKSSGYCAAMVYGCTGIFFETDLLRQAATNSQEFALVFLLPTLWYLLRYTESGKKSDLTVAAAGLSVMGLVHTFVFVYGFLLCTAVIVGRWLVLESKMLQKTGYILGYGVAASVISIAPIAIAYLAGIRPHSSSLEFLGQQMLITYPAIGLKEWIFIAGGVAVILSLPFLWKDRVQFRRMFVVLMIFVMVAFTYSVIPVVTQNLAFESRKSMLSLPFVGVAVGWIHWLILLPFKGKWKSAIGSFLAVSVFVGVLYWIQPQPFVPFKMERDASVVQYLRISQQFVPTSWTIVSQEEGYALAYGKGFHVFVRDFVKDIRSDKEVLTFVDPSKKEKLTQDVFIFYEKEVFRSEYDNLIPLYNQREQDNVRLKAWLEDYQRRTDNLKIFYEDQQMTVYWIHNELKQVEKFEKIWNEQ